MARGLSKDEVNGVYRRYGGLLERRCRLLTRDAALAEDALQELATALLRRGEAFREAESPYRWLCRAADRACFDLLRRGRRVRDALANDKEIAWDELDRIGPAPGIDAEARCVALEMLGVLDDEQQALAIMLFVDGMTQSEAATELGVSRVTINKRAQELRARLRLAEAT